MLIQIYIYINQTVQCIAADCVHFNQHTLHFQHNWMNKKTEDLLWFPNYCAKEILHRNFRLGNSMIVIQISDLLLENSMVVIHICWNLDGCHMWRRKCSHAFINLGSS